MAVTEIMWHASGWKVTTVRRRQILPVTTLHPHQVINVYRGLLIRIIIINGETRNMHPDTVQCRTVLYSNVPADRSANVTQRSGPASSSIRTQLKN